MRIVLYGGEDRARVKETASCNRKLIISQVEDSPFWERKDRVKRRTGMRTWLPVTVAKPTQVLYRIEDSPVGREDGVAKRTVLRKWVPVAGSYSI